MLIGAVLLGMLLAVPLGALLPRVVGRDAGYPLAAVYLIGGVALGAHAPAILEGREVALSLPWVPAAGIRLTLVLDGLSLLFAWLVLGIGALVMAYSARYLDPGQSHGRLYGLLTLFAASMLGLVLAGDLILLFVFWELTSIASFLLIGGRGEAEAKGPAMRALLVTGVGGLALLAGSLLLASVTGTFDLSRTIESAGVVRGDALWPAILTLVLVAAFTKSAQVPFHFWLPGAMVAPTPVSTYLHAATMVKAGIYLLARLSPLFAGRPAWLYAVVLTGLATAVVGAFLALKQHDLKALLAYSTVSQLGFITALVGVGTFPALAAAAISLLAHGLYKGALFMVAGIIEHEAGSRDIRRLTGLRRAMPLTAAVTALAALSMAGLPLLLGFVSKEEAFKAFLGAPGTAWMGPLATTLAVAAAAMTFANAARIFEGAFGGPPTEHLREPAASFLTPAAVGALAGLALGLGVGFLNPIVNRVAAAAYRGPGEVDLALWHGLTPPLALSATTVSLGLILFLARGAMDRTLDRLRLRTGGAELFDASYDGVVTAGVAVGRPFLSTAPAAHLVWAFAAVAAVAVGVWAARGVMAEGPAPTDGPADWGLTALLAVAAVGTARAMTRIGAVAMLGITGFVVALVYASLGAPDLVLTQLLVETLTVMLVVLVFRGLPQRLRQVSRSRRRLALVAASGMGALVSLGAYALTGRRGLSDAGAYFLAAAPDQAGGRNVVNTIIVDFRALDTLGEITVLAVAALGLLALGGLIGKGPR